MCHALKAQLNKTLFKSSGLFGLPIKDALFIQLKFNLGISFASYQYKVCSY